MKQQYKVEPHDHQTLAYFVEDRKGGWFIECQSCNHQQMSYGGCEEEYCESCRYELLYPAGASW